MGYAEKGGGFYVGENADLKITACEITHCIADQWGGGVDVNGGSLSVRSSLFLNNRTTQTVGKGGGAISAYTDYDIDITNSAFSNNNQYSEDGIGGGAIYIENKESSSLQFTTINHCTFHNNDDSKGTAGAICTNVFGVRLSLVNSIFSGEQSKQLNVLGASEISSLGGNVCSTDSRIELSLSGRVDSYYLLDHPTDLTETDPLLGELTGFGYGTRAYIPMPDSPAIGRAVVTDSKVDVDQLGVFRGESNTSGSIEFGSKGRLLINEIHYDNKPGDDQFVEIYNPVSYTHLTLPTSDLV